MAVLTVRNVPDDIHRALRLRAAQHGRSTEAEIRDILQEAVKPKERVKVGSLLAEMSRRAGLTNEDVLALERTMKELRESTPLRAGEARMILLDTNVVSDELLANWSTIPSKSSHFSSVRGPRSPRFTCRRLLALADPRPGLGDP